MKLMPEQLFPAKTIHVKQTGKVDFKKKKNKKLIIQLLGIFWKQKIAQRCKNFCGQLKVINRVIGYFSSSLCTLWAILAHYRLLFGSW